MKIKLFNSKKGIGFFEIIIMILSVVSFSYIVSDVKAQSSTYCCEKTKDGAWCQNAPKEECDPSYASTPTSCETTSYCKLGCCYDSQEGICMENTPEKICEMRNGTWNEDSSCNIPQCELGCCILNGQAAFVTLTRCKKLSSFYGLETDFRRNVKSEIECISLASLEDVGACVYEVDYQKTCKFTTRQECDSIKKGLKEKNGTITSSVEFYKDYLCSAEELGTNCAPTDKTACKDGKIYFVDSCGNIANIYDANKINDKSYWRKIVPIEESCGYGKSNVGSKECGNCDYLLGSRCEKATDVKPRYGDYICRDLNCKIDGKLYKHGESWCSTDKYIDSVGSRYYRHICIDGEEIIEPCADFRNEICIEDSIKTNEGEFKQAACVANRWHDCTSQKTKKDCENTDQRDCKWISNKDEVGEDTIGCVPLHAPGFNFWSDSESVNICGQASTTCVVTFEKGLIGGEKCKENCECLTDAWRKKQEEKCQALGDCGGKINYLGIEGGKKKINVLSKLFLPLIYVNKILYEGFVLVNAQGCSGLSLIDCKKNPNCMWVSYSNENEYIGTCVDNPSINIAQPTKQDQPSITTAPPNLIIPTSGESVKSSIPAVESLILKESELNDVEQGHLITIFYKINENKKLSNDDINFLNSVEKKISNKELVNEIDKIKEVSMSTTPSTQTSSVNEEGKVPVNLPFVGTVARLSRGPAAIIKGFTYSLAIMGAIQLFGSMFGMSKELQKALTVGTFAGIMTSQLIKGFAPKEGVLYGKANLIGVGVGLLVFLLTYKKESKKIVKFDCYAWEAPVGGNKCEECNKEKGCSEYRCKSLGQACELINKGTEEEKCVWVNPKDVTSPIITTWDEPLNKDYKYQPDTSIRPPARGVKIINTKSSDGCLKAFTPLTFGISTNEPSQCKIDFEHTANYSDMKFFMGNSNLFAYNHTQTLSLPSPTHLRDLEPTLQHDGTYSWYIRCKDANGNYNIDEFVVSFCVEKGPDVEPPVIVNTNPLNGAPIPYNLSQIEIEVYTNEPAECKWSRIDQSYETMENSMRCDNKIWEMNNQEVYKCVGNLTGLQNRIDNIYYIKCKDQPWKNESDRNVNTQSYKYILKGTIPLNIASVGPNGTIKGSTDVIGVILTLETSNGANEGDAWCYYSQDNKTWIKMYETGTNKHSQRQDLTAGNYTYYFKCVDRGGNVDYSSTNFVVYVDKDPPLITRVYQEEGKLKVFTDEESNCVYQTNPSIGCNFKIEEGIVMPYINTTEHFAEWQEGRIYYIKCEDKNGNIPLPTQCSIIVTAKS